MMAVYQGCLPEQIPIGIYERYLPRGTVERAARTMGLGLIAYYPVVSMIGPPWHRYPGYLSEIAGAEFRVDYGWDHGVLVERRAYVTPVGEVWQEISYDDAGIGSERIRKYYITERQDYRILEYLVEHTVLRKNEAELISRMRDLGEDGVLFGRLDRSPYQKCLIELAGPERFLIDLHTDPEPVQALLDALLQKQEQAWMMALESPVELFWQPDNITAEMTPPEAFRDYCKPLYQKRAEEAGQAGKRFLVHMDGRLRALATVIQECGIHVLESFSLPDIGGDLALSEAQSSLPATVIVPNIPATWFHLSDEEVQLRLRNLLTKATRDTPLMLQLSEDFPNTEWQRVIPLLVPTTMATVHGVRSRSMWSRTEA